MIKQALKHYTGYSFLRWKLRPCGIYVFNYHRLGDAETAQFDPNLYSCSPEDFRSQLGFYRENFQLINLEELNQLIISGKPLDDRYALITFDDGYVDNYRLAYPELRAQNASAIFFVVIDYADNQILPWWDKVAWLVRNSEHSSVHLDHWKDPVALDGMPAKQSIREVLKNIKADTTHSIDENVAMLGHALGESDQPPVPDVEPFISWSQLREMQNGGMDIGSHTHSHRILAHLTERDQAFELQASKARLESELQVPIQALAYPVGGRTAFNETSVRLACSTGYKVAFSFIPGINTALGQQQVHRMLRMPVEHGMRLRHLKQIV